ncbi:hypothetical protein ACVGOW_19660 [Pseudonocardia saturnea]
MQRRTLGLIITVVVAAVAVVAGLIVIDNIGGDRAPAMSAEEAVSARDGGTITLAGATLVVPPGAVSADARLVATTIGAPPQPEAAADTSSPSLSPASAPVSFELVGAQIQQPVQITFLVPSDALPANPTVAGDAAAVWLSSYDPGADRWQPTPSRFDPAAGTVTAEVSHLSWWMPQTWDWRGIEVHLRQSLSAVGSGRAPQVDCAGASGVTVTSGGGSDPPIIGCAADKNPTDLTVSITNNRAYSMVVQAPDEAVLGPPTYAGFEEYLQTRDSVVEALGGPYLAPTSTVTYTLAREGEPVVVSAAPSVKTRVLDLAAPTATAVFNVVTAGYAECILDTVARSGPAPLSDAPELVVKCMPVLAQINAFAVQPVAKFVQGILEDVDLVRDIALEASGEVRIERPALPTPNLYISTGYERGALYVHPDFPATIGLDNHNYISALIWTNPAAGRTTATGVLNENNCDPACAGGTYSTYPVEVVASDPRRCTVTVYQDYSDATTSVEAYVFSSFTVRAARGSPSPYNVGDSVLSAGCR